MTGDQRLTEAVPQPAGDDGWGDEQDATGEIAAPPLDLGSSERWVLAEVRRHGVGRFVTLMTAAAMLASGLLVSTWLVIRHDLDHASLSIPAIGLSMVIPAVLAPPLLLVSARLVARLDTAAQLLRVSAVTDPLTGVANRRGFFSVLGRFGPDEVIEVAMVDLDDFKWLNDHHGHAAGDEALRTVAGWLVELVGDHGAVGRIGGDEFAIAARADAYRVIPSRQRFANGDLDFTASIGTAAGEGSGAYALLLAADRALYEQKQSERPILRSEPRTDRRSA